MEFDRFINALMHILIYFVVCTVNKAVMDDNLKAVHVFSNHVIFSCANRKLEGDDHSLTIIIDGSV